MKKEKLEIIYEDDDLLVIDKPAGINSDDFEKRIHRLDKDTSGILLIAKSNKALDFFQKQFKNRTVIKKYLALVSGTPSSVKGKIETFIGRSLKNRKKQKTYLPNEPDVYPHTKRGQIAESDSINKISPRSGVGARRKGLRKAITEYRILERFKEYSLIEAEPKTGRKHQIRCHFAALGHPIAGDKLYGFKNQPCPKELKRQFLHASYLKIKMPDNKTKEFKSELPKDLKEILCQL